MDCPAVTGDVPPLSQPEDIRTICGKYRGIQGHHNSCYLDATLFSMFSFSPVFDCILHRPSTKDDIEQYSSVQQVLKEEIVNPLRRYYFTASVLIYRYRVIYLASRKPLFLKLAPPTLISDQILSNNGYKSIKYQL